MQACARMGLAHQRVAIETDAEVKCSISGRCYACISGQVRTLAAFIHNRSSALRILPDSVFALEVDERDFSLVQLGQKSLITTDGSS